MGCSYSQEKSLVTNTKSVKSTPQNLSKEFNYHKGKCGLEYYEPINEVAQGSISHIHLVRKRATPISIPYEEKVNIMDYANTSNTENLTSSEPIYAMKTIIKEFVGDETFLEAMRREIYTMSQIEHSNVAKVYEAFERKNHIYLIMEYCKGGDLENLKLNESEINYIIWQILDAVDYLHQHHVVHRDLKLENVMLDSDGNVKIIDFGLATQYLSQEHKKMKDKVGTLYSVSPQVLQGDYDEKCDLWSIGVICYILLSHGIFPFWGNPNENLPWKQRKKVMASKIMLGEYAPMKGEIWKNVSEEGKQFVKRLLQRNAQKRPNAKEALNLSWMKKFPHVDKKIKLNEVEILEKENKKDAAKLIKKALNEIDQEGIGVISKKQIESLVKEVISEQDLDYVLHEAQQEAENFSENMGDDKISIQYIVNILEQKHINDTQLALSTLNRSFTGKKKEDEKEGGNK